MELGDRTVGDMGGEAVPVIDTFALLENLCEATMLRDAAFVLLAAPDSNPLAERAALSVGGGDARCVIVELPVPTPPVVVGEAERKDEPVSEDAAVLLKEVLPVADVE